MGYDHRTKAGNQADVAKHAALIVLIARRLSAGTGSGPIRYADVCAGPARSPAAHSPGLPDGAGHLASALALWPRLMRGSIPRELRWFVDRYAPPRRAAWKTYPGSSTIVADLCADSRAPLALTAWDIAPDAAASLREALGRNPGVTVHARAATPADEGVTRADVLLLDPPGIGERFGLRLADLADIARAAPPAAWTLIWLPILEGAEGDDAAARAWIGSLADPSLPPPRALGVRWPSRPSHGKMVGCLLVLRAVPDGPAIAVRSLLSWLARHVFTGAHAWSIESIGSWPADTRPGGTRFGMSAER
ncbi:MAG: hypothetical protein JNM07_01475 [Phycisphaerae bacterium]|nr:hypothetical protein [Phycisphaerae bacterium]